MSGKGSSPRPFSVDRKTFENNWDKIFKKDNWDHYSDLPNPDSYKNDYTENCMLLPFGCSTTKEEEEAFKQIENRLKNK